MGGCCAAPALGAERGLARQALSKLVEYAVDAVLDVPSTRLTEDRHQSASAGHPPVARASMR